MGFPVNRITLLLVSACTLVVHGQENAQTRIPDSLIECYRNLSLRNPQNRPPMTMQTFIDIVRKIETFQRGTVNMPELTTSILHSFRLDGIERSPGVVEAAGVLPFAVRGVPFFKHRLILRYLVPANNQQFPNESLSQVERCTLHFMLSHTIDTAVRGDESAVCSRLSNYESGNRIQRHARFRRQTEEEEPAVNAAEEHKSEEGNSDLKDAEQIPLGDTENKSEDSAENSGDTSKQVPKDTDESKEAGEQDTTLKQQAEVVNSTTGDNETKSGKFIHDDDMPSYNFPNQKARNVVEPETETDIDIQSSVTLTTTESDCPVEGGAVWTRWGTVSLGPVLAGIAAGMFSQIVPLPDIVRKSPPEINLTPELFASTIDNRFAATLVGDLAEAALQQGPRRRDNIKIGLTGGWNSTTLPRWYFQREKDGHEMTDAEIRGGLDGLVMGTFIEEWRRRVTGGELRLSQLLSMYYSEHGAFNTRFRACQRRDLFSEVAPNNRLEEETFRFAVALDIQSFTSASVDIAQINTFAQTAVRRLSTYLPSMNDRQCSPRAVSQPILSAFTNVTVVIDRNWPFQDIRELLSLLAGELDISEFGSRLTVVNGRNGAAFFTDAMSSLDIETNFTLSQYNNHETGMDIPRLLEQELRRSMEGLLNAESARRQAGGRSTVILFMPFTPVNLNDNDLAIARDRVNHFRERLPDVRFLYFAPGNIENYRQLVENPTTDVFIYTSLPNDTDRIRAISSIGDRIKQVPLRLSNPTCGANWTSENYVTADFVHSVEQAGVKYHRLHPNFFFGMGSAELTVLSSNSQGLSVCHSRRHETPDNATNDVTCAQTQGGNVVINLGNGCEGTNFIAECRPLFISVRPVNSTSQTANCMTTDCAFPTNVLYTIRNRGLGCMAGAGHLLSNPQFIFLTAALTFLTKYLKVGS